MSPKNQGNFTCSLIVVRKLAFLFMVLASIDAITAYPDFSKLILLVHDRECHVTSSVTDVLVEHGAFSALTVPTFAAKLNSLVQRTRENRLRMSLTDGKEETRLGRRLSDMDWEERRDEIISSLDILVKDELCSDSTDPSHVICAAASHNATSSVVYAYHNEVAVDVIDDGLLPNHQILKMAKKLPCLRFPPQRNQIYHSLRSPNDYNPEEQWYLEPPPRGIGATKAWTYHNGQRTGLVVAVIDTGCSNNPDLERNLCSSKENCFGFDAIYGQNPYNEQFTHGTPVSGFVAAVSNNNHGLAGVCWGCRIMCLKSGDADGNSWLHTIVAAIQYILSKKPIVKITNHSYGGYGPLSQTDEAVYADLRTAGILAVAAAGNDNCNMDQPNSNECLNKMTNRPRGQQRPAGLPYDNILSVGASDIRNQKASFSNYGKTTVDLFAPGSRVKGLCNTKLKNCITDSFDGTSFSSPLTAGAAGLIWSRDPTMTYKDVKDILMQTVHKVPALENFCVTGGILDVGAAMERVIQRIRKRPTPSYDIIPTPVGDTTVDFSGPNFREITPNPPIRYPDPAKEPAPVKRPAPGKRPAPDRKRKKLRRGKNYYDDDSRPPRKRWASSAVNYNYSIFFPFFMISLLFIIHDSLF